MKVYIVTEGAYSGYHIERVFLDKKKAEEYVKFHSGNLNMIFDDMQIEEYETYDDKFITEKENSPCIRVTLFYNFEENKITENYSYYKNENDVKEENLYRENYCELPMKLIVTRKYNHQNGFDNIDIERDIEKTKRILHDLITQVTYLVSEGATEEMINDAIKI